MKKLIAIIGIIIVSITSNSIVRSQTFLNGNFEKNTAIIGTDLINLSNVDFNSKMENTFAFGSYGDMDIINTATYNGLPQNGSWYVALTGGGTDAISMELSSKLVSGKTYTISFWDRGSSSYQPLPFQMGVSNDKRSIVTAVATAETPVVGVWTKRTLTFIAPMDALYITIQMTGVNNLQDWAHVDNFMFENPSNFITTGKIEGSPFCACSSLEVPFQSKGAFLSDNQYIAQLSDENGSFSKPVNIGVLKSNLNSGVISCSLPCVSVAGSLYRIRVISTTPEIIGTENKMNLTINSSVTPEVVIEAHPGNNIKEGTTITFQAIAHNGGTKPIYQWMVNGEKVGINSSTFTSSKLKNNDVVTVSLISNAPCATTSSANSNSISINIEPPEQPNVVIEVSPSSTIQKGKNVTFRATPYKSGSMPSYQWKINGENVGGNSVIFNTSNIKDGDVVTVVMTSYLGMSVPHVIGSNVIVMTVIVPEKKEKAEIVKIANVKKAKFNLKREFSNYFKFSSSNTSMRKKSLTKKLKISGRKIKRCPRF
ncbi:MAG: carbohydrate binding domain-containing protein [Bacteroidetes bacterium]|nr:carbohydrate binding domain-containing protein [Bacteroidota bacterium]